jgi:hypothetical protein
VSALRACTSLVRRGLIVRKTTRFFGTVCELAVAPRTILNAAEDIEPRESEDWLEDMRSHVESLEGEERRRKRREDMRERGTDVRKRKSKHPMTNTTIQPFQLNAVAACLRMHARENPTESDQYMLDAKVISQCRKWWPEIFIWQCLEQLKASGDHDRIIQEARAELAPAQPS